MKKSKEKNITVIIPCYNYGRFLAEAVTSVLQQTRQASEILIADDCSTDNTREVAIKFRQKYPHLIRYSRNKENLGVVENFNKAVLLTCADYICFLNADDRFRKDYLEKAAAILDANREVGIVYSDLALFGPRAKIVYFEFPQMFKGPRGDNGFYIINFPDYSKETRKILAKQNFIHGGSMFRRKVYNEIGGYRKGSYPEDHDFAMQIIKGGWLAKRVPLPTYEYRQHSPNQVNIKRRKFYTALFLRHRLLFSPIMKLLSCFHEKFKYY